MRARPSAGATLALIGLALLVAGWAFDPSPLFVPAAGFILLGTGVPLWVWACARAAGIRRELVSERVLEGEPFEMVVEVRRPRMGPPSAELLDPMAGEPVPLGRRVDRVSIVGRAQGRGLHRLPPPTLVLRDGLGLAEIRRAGEDGACELLVLPRTERVRWPGGRAPSSLARNATTSPASESLAAFEFDGLRPYQEGTPASRIHWPALARGGELLERRLRGDVDRRPVVVLDARSEGDEALLDTVVRAAASLTLELARRGGCRLLLPGERRALTIEPDLRAWPSAHGHLALVQDRPGARAPLLTPDLRDGPVIYVAVRAPDHLPEGGSAGGVLVIPRASRWQGGGQVRFEVSACRGYELRPRSRRRTGLGAERAA